MKKNVLKVALLAVVAVATSVNFYGGHSEATFSDVVIANVEALANTEETPCSGARHCTQMDNQVCWYYNINGDNNMMVSSYNHQVHRGQD